MFDLGILRTAKLLAKEHPAVCIAGSRPGELLDQKPRYPYRH